VYTCCAPRTASFTSSSVECDGAYLERNTVAHACNTATCSELKGTVACVCSSSTVGGLKCPFMLYELLQELRSVCRCTGVVQFESSALCFTFLVLSMMADFASVPRCRFNSMNKWQLAYLAARHDQQAVNVYIVLVAMSSAYKHHQRLYKLDIK
jgi:hypothetical protein